MRARVIMQTDQRTKRFTRYKERYLESFIEKKKHIHVKLATWE